MHRQDYFRQQLRNPIAEAAETGRTELQFPGWHPMQRWDSTAASAAEGRIGGHRIAVLGLAGRLGDTVDFADLPGPLQTPAMAAAVGSVAEYPAIGFAACGSRGETANEPTLANRFHTLDINPAVNEGVDQPQLHRQEGKEMVWTTVVLTAPDQVIHRR